MILGYKSSHYFVGQNGKYPNTCLLYSTLWRLCLRKVLMQLFELWDESSTIFIDHHFSLNEIWWTNYSYSYLGVWQTSSRKRTMWVCDQGKQLMLFFASDKIWASKQKLEFERTFFCHHELDGDLILTDFSDEVDDDINKCDIFIL